MDARQIIVGLQGLFLSSKQQVRIQGLKQKSFSLKHRATEHTENKEARLFFKWEISDDIVEAYLKNVTVRYLDYHMK